MRASSPGSLDAAERPGIATTAPADWLARARALRPLLEAAGPRGDAGRELAADVVEALHAEGLFRLLVPRDLGGAELDVPGFVRVVEAVAEGDGSAAWCVGQNAVSNMTSAYLPPAEAELVFGRDPRAVVAWGAGPSGQAVEVAGGFRVTGSWSFASGSRHANWLGGLCPIVAADGSHRLELDGGPLIRTFVFPKASCRIVDDWHVIGLRGTGSDSYAITDVFVPEAHHYLRTVPAPRAGALYRLPLIAVYPAAFAGVALGLARAMLDGFVAMAREKSPRGLPPMRDNAAVRSLLGHAATRLGSARANLLHALAEIVASLAAGAPFRGAHEVTLRGCTTFAIQEAVAVADVLYHEAGATAIMQGNPFERRFRDIHAVAQQIQGRRANFELVGQRLLGIETGPLFI
jgi:alkylation response protein AidB-like acyl-CoA dehydrogenase